MISPEKALEIAKAGLGSLIDYELQVSDGAQNRFALYGSYDWDRLWVVTVHESNRELILEPTFIVLIHKESGEVVYSGDASDEG